MILYYMILWLIGLHDGSVQIIAWASLKNYENESLWSTLRYKLYSQVNHSDSKCTTVTPL